MAAVQQAQPGQSRHPTPTERADRGKAARAAAPRSEQGEFAEEYADQNERDCDALRDAAASGRIAVETGL